MPLPRRIEPQLSKLAVQAPSGPRWVHEIKFDGYRMAARIERGQVKLLTRSGLDWTDKYPAMAAAFAELRVKSAYIDGELCGVRPDGVTSFEVMQQVSDSGGGHLTYFAFDLLELNGEDVSRLPLGRRKARLAALLKKPPVGITYSEHDGADGEAFRRAACEHGLEGVVSKRPTCPICPAIVAPGSSPSALTGPSSSSSAGPIRRGRGRSSARCCSAITSRTAGCSMPAGWGRECRQRR